MTEDRRQNAVDDGRWMIRLSPFVVTVIRLLAVSTLALTGCAVSPKKAPSAALTIADPNSASQASADNDFGLLEEQMEEQTIEVPDPLEPWNRMMFQVNDRLYFWVVKPVAQTYKNVVPEPARLGIRNFFDNVRMPIRYVNCLLQGKNAAADVELRRFLINTTAGVLGFGDPALDRFGLKPVDEDLGQTLATHGFDSGFYIVWPFFGPSTVRDSVGMLGDQFLNPLWYVQSTELSIGLSAVQYTNAGSFEIGRYEVFKAAAVDPYVAMRQSYIQYRQKQIKE